MRGEFFSAILFIRQAVLRWGDFFCAGALSLLKAAGKLGGAIFTFVT